MQNAVMIGTVTDFFSHVSVAGIDLIDTLKKGDLIHIFGHSTDMIFEVDSLQIDHKPVISAGPGESVGVLVDDRVHRGDKVFKLIIERPR